MKEKPLHVRVALALGWSVHGPISIGDRECGGTEFWVLPGQDALSYCNVCAPTEAPPRFDTDWKWGGPLIERYGIRLYPPSVPPTRWEASKHWAVGEYVARHGDTPLIAVCNLILVLHAAGKLREATEPEHWYCLGCANATAYHHICHGTRLGRACECQACPSALMAQRTQRESK